MLVVVSDSSPVIYLTRLGLLELLRKLHDAIIVPKAVWEEVVIGGAGLPESDNLRRAVAEGWIEVKSPAAPPSTLGPGATLLGDGEVEAILLAKELQAVLLTDDLEGREFAERGGLKVIGTVGVLIRAKSEGHLAELKSLLDRLRAESSFRMSERLYQDALKVGGEAA